jgi:hypothetical protein
MGSVTHLTAIFSPYAPYITQLGLIGRWPAGDFVRLPRHVLNRSPYLVDNSVA